jgi:hypothetical protein
MERVDDMSIFILFFSPALDCAALLDDAWNVHTNLKNKTKNQQ